MTEDLGQAGAEIEITPAMIAAGVQALVRHYDPEEGGLDNIKLTVRAVLVAGFNCGDHGTDIQGGIARELSRFHQL